MVGQACEALPGYGLDLLRGSRSSKTPAGCGGTRSHQEGGFPRAALHGSLSGDNGARWPGR